MAKKQVRKRQAWNKGLEVGKKDGFTPHQVKRIRSLLTVRAGSEIWPFSRRQLIPCCMDKTCCHSLLEMCSVAMVQSVKLLKLRVREECHQCDAPCQGHPQRRLKNGSLRPAKSALIISSRGVALAAVIRWGCGN